MLVDAVRFGDLDVDEPGLGQRSVELGAGEGAGDAAGPLLHVAAGGVVHVLVGDHVGDREAPAGLSTRAASRSTRCLSPARLITQLEITTSTASSGSGMSSR